MIPGYVIFCCLATSSINLLSWLGLKVLFLISSAIFFLHIAQRITLVIPFNFSEILKFFEELFLFLKKRSDHWFPLYSFFVRAAPPMLSMWPCTSISHVQVSYLVFSNLTHKMKLGLQNEGDYQYNPFLSWWISARIWPLLGRCDEPNRHRALSFAKDYLGCGWRLLIHDLNIHPFLHLHHWLRDGGDCPIIDEHYKYFHLFCCRM